MGSSDKRQRTTQPDAIDVAGPSNRKKQFKKFRSSGVQEFEEFKEENRGAGRCFAAELFF